MEQQVPLFVKMALQSWESNIQRADKLFTELTDEQLLLEVAPGKNRAYYLLGHFVAVHDRMLTLLGLGERQYPQLDAVFLSAPDNVEATPFPVHELRTQWKSINETLEKIFTNLPAEEWFYKHTSVSEEDFKKEPHRNRMNVLLSRTNHVSYHLGQLVLIKK
ncbi:hypothetical protein F5148DRAFT_1290685 [Russula earlei]|uniref:Uncharacterized protein n=1 Tax=Russula earlei TaxID=71964 RepID=A0ACC0TVF1_9AGAM|nr:hypothetical protein F5148DRAFT_1290685 [Russula earlei]